MKRSTNYVVLRAVVVGAFLILIGRLWYMQVVRVNAYRAQAIAAKLQYRYVLAPRGIIYDRYGRPLVRNLPSLDVAITPIDWPGKGAIRESRLLSSLLHGSPRPGRIRGLVTAQEINPTRPVAIKTNLSLRTFYLIRSHADQLPGVSATEDFSHRHYMGSAPWPLSHILGYVGLIGPVDYKIDANPQGPYAYQRYTYQDSTGQAGIESVYDHALHGINGLQSSEINALGNQVTGWKTVSPAVPGNGIRLTIDSHLEEAAARDLQAGIQKLSAKHGAAVVMNPNNGQVLALVSLPSFNANIFTSAPGPKRTRAINHIAHDPAQPLYDISTQGAMPPGSIYKVITATAGLESGVINPQTTMDDTGTLQKCPTCPVFHGWNPNGLGSVNVVTAIEQSSDIFFYQVAGGGPDLPGNGVGPQRLDKWARKYGLGQPTGVGLPGEAAGLVPSPRELWKTQRRPWSYGDSYNMGIGQGDNLVTAIQMATVVSVVANGGNLVRPSIVAAITSPNGLRALQGHNFSLVPDIVSRHFVAPWIVSLISQGMRLGVTNTNGTSHYNVDLRNQSAGKTGTAQAGLSQYDGWWIGFAPYDHPKIAVCVVVPNSGAEGAFSAAPIGSKIMDDYFHISDPNWLNQVVRKIDFVN